RSEHERLGARSLLARLVARTAAAHARLDEGFFARAFGFALGLDPGFDFARAFGFALAAAFFFVGVFAGASTLVRSGASFFGGANSTRAAASSTAPMPSPVAPDIGSTAMPRFLSAAASLGSSSRANGRSSLLATTTCGRWAMAGLYFSSSPFST